MSDTIRRRHGRASESPDRRAHPEGALVERAAPTVRPDPAGFRLQLRRPDFITASRIAERLNDTFPDAVARAENSAAVTVRMPAGYQERPVEFIAQIHALDVPTDRRAKVVLNERTGTVVIGSEVRIAPVAVLHGNLTVQIVTDFVVSQPPPLSPGETVVTPQADVRVQEQKAHQVLLQEGASVEDLIKALMAIGSTPRDIIAIMQSIAAAGALEAELEVISVDFGSLGAVSLQRATGRQEDLRGLGSAGGRCLAQPCVLRLNETRFTSTASSENFGLFRLDFKPGCR